MVSELWDPLRKALDGSLTGSGTLATVLLCETLLSYLPTGFQVTQPTKLLKAYDVLPSRSDMADPNRIDLRQHATIKGGVLYVRRPVLERVWVPLGSLPPSARQTAKRMLDFLETIREGKGAGAVTKAAKAVIIQFKNDLLDLGIVTNTRTLDGDIQDGTVVETMTATDYVNRVFRHQWLPADMGTKSLLKMSVDIFGEQEVLHEVAAQLLHCVKTLPKLR